MYIKLVIIDKLDSKMSTNLESWYALDITKDSPKMQLKAVHTEAVFAKSVFKS